MAQGSILEQSDQKESLRWHFERGKYSVLYDVFPLSMDFLYLLLADGIGPPSTVAQAAEWAEHSFNKEFASLLETCYAATILCVSQMSFHNEERIGLRNGVSMDLGYPSVMAASCLRYLEVITTVDHHRSSAYSSLEGKPAAPFSEMKVLLLKALKILSKTSTLRYKYLVQTWSLYLVRTFSYRHDNSTAANPIIACQDEGLRPIPTCVHLIKSCQDLSHYDVIDMIDINKMLTNRACLTQWIAAQFLMCIKSIRESSYSHTKIPSAQNQHEPAGARKRMAALWSCLVDMSRPADQKDTMLNLQNLQSRLGFDLQRSLWSEAFDQQHSDTQASGLTYPALYDDENLEAEVADIVDNLNSLNSCDAGHPLV